MSREAFERHCPMPKGLVFNASLNRYDGGAYTSALSYNDMWCAWQHAWQAALQHSESEPVAWMSPNKQSLEFSRPDTVYGSHTIPLYTTPQPVVELKCSESEPMQQPMQPRLATAPAPPGQGGGGRGYPAPPGQGGGGRGYPAPRTYAASQHQQPMAPEGYVIVREAVLIELASDIQYAISESRPSLKRSAMSAANDVVKDLLSAGKETV